MTKTLPALVISLGCLSAIGASTAPARPGAERNAAGGVTPSRSLPVAPQCSHWKGDAYYDPPALHNPQVIVLSAAHRKIWTPPGLAAGNIGKDFHPRNYVYDVGTLDYNTDFIISAPFRLEHPLLVSGGRQIRLVGIDLKPVVRANGFSIQWGGPGTVLESESGTATNAQPRLPMSAVLTASGTKTLVLEGVLLDANLANADVVVSNNGHRFGKAMSSAAFIKGKQEVNFYVVNSRLIGGATSKRIHSDIWHHQNSTFNQFRMHNVTLETPTQGLTLQGENSPIGAGVGAYLRRVEWQPGPQAIRTGAGGATFFRVVDGARIATDPGFRNWEQVYLGEPWPTQRFRSIRMQSVNYWAHDMALPKLTRMLGVSAGKPPGGEFAPVARVGLNYGSQSCFK